MVQLDKDRKGQCKGVDDVGFRVLVRGQGGKDDNRAVKGMVVVDGAMELEHGVAMVHREE